MSEEPRLGVVVPTLNEADHLPGLLRDLTALPLPHRTVVVDGGSEDGTRTLAREAGAEVRRAPRGRASQLNAGARSLDTPWLLFLHADVRLEEGARRRLREWLDEADPETAGIFRFRLAGEEWFWRFIEFGQRLRERLYGLAYGDQGLLVHRRAFREVGGYPDLPIMEDVEILRRLRRNHRVRRIPADLVSSPRRYEREGRWFAWVRNAALITLYLAGVPARTLARWYRPEPATGRGAADSRPESDAEDDPGFSGPDRPRRGGTPETARQGEAPPPDTLLIFAKAPVAGRVKTRLAEDVGDRRAARLYREVGRRVVDQVRDGPYRTVIYYDPPGAEAEVRAWLGERDVRFHPQESGGLGSRMAAAFARAFRRSSRVCIVGTDAPDVDRSTVEEALARLGSADVVLGPATDGGYYLLALDRPHPELFQDVAWSTPDVLRTTLDRAREHDLRVHLLDERTDLDTAEDLQRLELDASPMRNGE